MVVAASPITVDALVRDKAYEFLLAEDINHNDDGSHDYQASAIHRGFFHHMELAGGILWLTFYKLDSNGNRHLDEYACIEIEAIAPIGAHSD